MVIFTNLTTSAHFTRNSLGWEIICTNVLITIYCFVVFILFLREPQGNAVEVWVTSYSLHYLIWKYPERTSANEGILRSVLLSKKQWIIRRNIYARGGNLLQKLKGVSLKKSFLSVVWADGTIKSAFLADKLFANLSVTNHTMRLRKEIVLIAVGNFVLKQFHIFFWEREREREIT